MRTGESKLLTVWHYRKRLVFCVALGTILVAIGILRVMPKTYYARAVVDYSGILRWEEQFQSSGHAPSDWRGRAEGPDVSTQ